MTILSSAPPKSPKRIAYNLIMEDKDNLLMNGVQDIADNLVKRSDLAVFTTSLSFIADNR